MTIETERALTPLSTAQRMLAEAKTLPELRELRDYATGAKAWAKARGLGIEAENEATEVILRAERSIGQNILVLREQGRFGNAGDSGDVRDVLVAAIEQAGPMTSAQLVEATGLPNKTVLQVLHNNPAFTKTDSTKGGTWDVVEERLETLRSFVRIKDLGITESESSNFQRLAAIDDDRFEATIRAIRESGVRLAKTDLYREVQKRDRVPDEVSRRVRALFDKEVDHVAPLRAAWEQINVSQLAEDELVALATLIREMAVAYNDERQRR